MRESDVRGTPWDLYHELTARFGECDLDVCAILGLAKCDQAYTLQGSYLKNGAAGWTQLREGCGLTLPWVGRVWCNPPFSEIETWVERAWRAMSCDNTSSILMIVPSNKSEQPWWQDLIEPYRDGKASLNGVRLDTYNLGGRRRFTMPDGSPIMSKADPTRIGSPAFGIVVLKWEKIERTC